MGSFLDLLFSDPDKLLGDEEQDEEERSDRYTGKTCQFCGECDLHWQDVGNEKFRLVDNDGEFHVCQQRAPGDDFDAM